MHERHCTDQVVGDILSGWRYDISSLSPAMRIDYEQHLHECSHCRHRQTKARMVDMLLLAVSTLSIITCLLAEMVLRRFEALLHTTSLRLPLHHSELTVPLQMVAVAGLIFSMVLWVLVAIATPLPGFLSGILQERVPEDIRERFTRHA